MSIRVGIYDFFAYTLPGGFYLLISLFGLAVFGVIKVNLSMLNSLSLFSFLILLVAGYIVGLLLDPVAYKWSRLFQKRNREAKKFAFEEFHTRHPWMELDFDPADWTIMLFAIKSKSIDIAMDVEQHNVASIMLRNISLGLAIVSATLLLFFVIVSTNVWNLVLAGFFFSLSFIAIRRCRLRRHWFYMGVFEAFASIYLLEQEKWTGKKSVVTDAKRKNEVQENEISNPASSSKNKSVEYD